MPLDPFLASKIHLLEGLTYASLADAEALGRYAEFNRDPDDWAAPDAISVENHVVRGGEYDVPVRIYRPADARGATLVWAHGGGFVSGDLTMPEAHTVATELAHRAGATVISVDYRLVTESIKYPAPVDDFVTVWRWAAEHAAPSERLFIGGASAGGAISLSAAFRIRDDAGRDPHGILLAYPVAHFPIPALDDDALREVLALPAMLRLNPASIEWMIHHYAGTITAFPLYAIPGNERLAGLPPVTILACELDELRPSSELLATQLRESGVAVTYQVAQGMPHGHLNRTPSLPATDAGLQLFATSLGEADGMAV